MRIYRDEQKKELERVVCNACNREIKVENGIVKEGIFEGNQKFGFFSEKDGQSHHFDLCETCYDQMIQRFCIPVDKCDLTELL